MGSLKISSKKKTLKERKSKSSESELSDVATSKTKEASKSNRENGKRENKRNILGFKFQFSSIHDTVGITPLKYRRLSSTSSAPVENHSKPDINVRSKSVDLARTSPQNNELRSFSLDLQRDPFPSDPTEPDLSALEFNDSQSTLDSSCLDSPITSDPLVANATTVVIRQRTPSLTKDSEDTADIDTLPVQTPGCRQVTYFPRFQHIQEDLPLKEAFSRSERLSTDSDSSLPTDVTSTRDSDVTSTRGSDVTSTRGSVVNSTREFVFNSTLTLSSPETRSSLDCDVVRTTTNSSKENGTSSCEPDTPAHENTHAPIQPYTVSTEDPPKSYVMAVKDLIFEKDVTSLGRKCSLFLEQSVLRKCSITSDLSCSTYSRRSCVSDCLAEAEKLCRNVGVKDLIAKFQSVIN